MEKLIGIDIAQSTFNKYDFTYRRLKEFLKVKMRKSNILLCQVDRNFVMDFETYKECAKVETMDQVMYILVNEITKRYLLGQVHQDFGNDEREASVH